MTEHLSMSAHDDCPHDLPVNDCGHCTPDDLSTHSFD